MSEPMAGPLRGLDFRDPDGAPVPHDGTAPVTWRVGAYALATRAGRVLLIDPVYSRRAELPGGGVDVHETLLEGAARECLEETGYRFVAADPAPVHVGEQFFCWRQTDPADPGLRYWHTVAVVFAGTVEGDADPAWTPDPREVRRVRWVDPADLTPETTRPDHWAALRRAGLV